MSSTTDPDATFTPNSSQGGTDVTLTWTTTGGSCPSDSTTIVITVLASTPPTATIGVSSQTVCPNSASISLAASVGGSATGGIWSGFGVGVMSSTTDGAATFSPHSTQGGTTVTLIWTSTGGPCGAASASVSIIVPQPSTSSIGVSSQQVCVGASSVPLAATFGGSATGGVWTGFGGGFMSSATDKDAIFTPVESQQGSTVTLTWTTAGGSCPSTSTVDIAVFAKAIASVGPSQTVCPLSATASLNATFGGAATGGVWSGFGDGAISSLTDADATFTPTLTQAGSTVQLSWTTTGGSCIVIENVNIQVSDGSSPIPCSATRLWLPSMCLLLLALIFTL